MISFKGKFFIVTGGSRGIGKAIALQLLENDARVLIASAHSAPEWCAQYNYCEHVQVDLCSKSAVDHFCDIIRGYDSIDGLVNCAGMFYSAPLDDVDDKKYDDVMSINLRAPFQLCRAVAGVMRKNKEGRIVNVSSIAAVVSRPGSHAYSASKAGLVGLTKALALELAENNILVNALCPGYTETDMTNGAVSVEQKEELRLRVPLKRIAFPEDIARHAVFLLSDWNTYATGQAFIVDGGVTVL